MVLLTYHLLPLGRILSIGGEDPLSPDPQLEECDSAVAVLADLRTTETERVLPVCHLLGKQLFPYLDVVQKMQVLHLEQLGLHEEAYADHLSRVCTCYLCQ